MTHRTRQRKQAMKTLMKTYKIYLHGEFVAVAHAETRGEAVTQVANKYYGSNEAGLMAVFNN